MNMRRTTIALLTAGLLLAAPAFAAPSAAAGEWDETTLDQFATLPILDGGRVKPLDTYASFLMLRLNGKRSMDAPSGDGKLTPIEWFLDCLFYPDVAVDYPHFVIDNADVVSTIGATRHDDLRDRYSYNELLPARAELFRRAQEAQILEQTKRSPTQSMILALAQAVFEFETIIHYLDFTKAEFDTSSSALAQRIFGDEQDLSVSRVIERGRDLQLAIAALRQIMESGEGAERAEEERAAFEEFFGPLDLASQTAMALALIPPTDIDDKEWLTPSDLVNKTFAVEQHDESELAMLAALERAARDRDNKLAFKQAVGEFHTLAVDQAKARGEYGKIPMEVSFYRVNFFGNAQVLFIISFVIAALSWLNLRSRGLKWASIVSVSIPLLLLVAGITYRSIIRGRPPVSTLYETVLFITAVSVASALFMEYIDRRRIAISVATFLGTLGIFIANRYEITNKADTMPVLVAVLDTNFWLATHVIIINIGYAAGLLAAAIAHVYIIGKVLGIKRNDKPFYKSVTRMVYGSTCFGLIFAFIGTVLGGIWANYSWGRFWGWDPKENGAALICLCMLATLHARMGGYIRDLGLHIAAVLTGCVVAFSWWGVNLLGVGLHSYGFTSGIWTATFAFWVSQGVVILLGLFAGLRAMADKSPKKTDADDQAGPVPAK